MEFVKLTEEEKEKEKRLKEEGDEVGRFASEIFEQCRQKEFTVRQFNVLVNSLDIKRQLMNDRAAGVTRISMIYPGPNP